MGFSSVSQLNSPIINAKKTYRIVFEQYFNPLCNFAFTFVKDHGKAKDVVQDVFIKFWYNLDTFESEEHQKAFLFKATKNQAIDELRKQESNKRTLEQWKDLKSWSENDENQMEKLILIEKIYKATDLLPPKCREIFILHKKEGYSYKEIAKIKSLSIKTVENQMLIALKKLRELVSM